MSKPTDPNPHEHWTLTNPQTPNSHSDAPDHAGGGIINDASQNANSHALPLPELITQTGHDWFFHL
jgi:hypothetical protein